MSKFRHKVSGVMVNAVQHSIFNQSEVLQWSEGSYNKATLKQIEGEWQLIIETQNLADQVVPFGSYVYTESGYLHACSSEEFRKHFTRVT